MSDDSAASPKAKRRSVPFLGGLVSAALFYLSTEEEILRHVAWFSLVPLLYSLHGARSSAPRRFLHGLSFLLALGFAFFRGDSAPVLLGLQSAMFGVAAGPILRSERRLARIVGLALLWTGLEVFRGPLCPFPQLLMPGWLALGSAIRAGSPESQTASLIGLHGLTFALSLSASFFFSVIIDGRLWRQILYLAAGLAIPLACRIHGLEHTPSDTLDVHPAELVLVSANTGDEAALAALTRRIPAPKDGLIVWPAISRESNANGQAGGELEATARERAAMVLTAASISPRDRPDHAVVADPQGAASVCIGDDGRTPILLRTARGLIGVGVEDAFDSPVRARESALRGAQLFVGVAREPSNWTGSAVRHRSTLQAYRGIENHRWVARVSRQAAEITDPLGQPSVSMHGVDWAGSGDAAWSDSRAIYTRWGWWIEPALVAGAGWVLVSAAIAWVTRRRNP